MGRGHYCGSGDRELTGQTVETGEFQGAKYISILLSGSSERRVPRHKDRASR